MQYLHTLTWSHVKHDLAITLLLLSITFSLFQIINFTSESRVVASVTTAVVPVVEVKAPDVTDIIDSNNFTKPVKPYKLNNKQDHLMQIAREEGTAIGWPETVQAILLKESTAGLNGPIGDHINGFGKRSYCHMQVKIPAARHVLANYDDLGTFKTDEELLVKLLTDDRFCIRVGARYFELMYQSTKSWSKAVLAYNRGLGGARKGVDPMNYVSGVKERIKTLVKPYNAYYDQVLALNVNVDNNIMVAGTIFL